MSTPQSPPQSPPAPVSSDGAQAHVETHDTSTDAARNGAPGAAAEANAHEAHAVEPAPPAIAPPEPTVAHAGAHGVEGAPDRRAGEPSVDFDGSEAIEPTGGEAGEGSGDGEASEGEGAEATGTAEGEAGSAAPAAGGEKKRRRRRRRKKSGAQAVGEEGAAEHPEPAAGDATAEAHAEPGAEGHPAEATEPGAPSAHGPGRGHGPREQQRDKKKERKHGPTRERPPVTVGDIIFGKILQITDEAIFIDIPGKAHAIFDRGEMMLPEDDEAARPAPAAPPPAVVTETAAPPIAEAAGAVPVQPPDGEAAPPDVSSVSREHAAPALAEPEPAADLAAPTAEPGPAGTTEVAAEEAGAAGHAEVEPAAVVVAPSPAPPVAHAQPEPPREPKVPRVILEVGADFIGVVHNDGMRGGLVVLTHHPRRAERTRALAEKAYNDKTPILGLVTGVIKGGIEVDVEGLRAFAPGSHVDLHMGADLSYLLGRRLSFLVTQYAKRGRDVVLSRKSMIEEEARTARIEALAKLKVGEDRDGVVRSVVPFGAFIDVGGIEGLVPLQEMSHNRADGPSDVFKAGEPTRVRVVKIDDRGKVWLSRKATIPDPWQQVAQKYALGTRHAGKVVRIQPFGAFVELEPGVDGLVHTVDLSIKRIEGPGDVVKVGDPLEVVVANVDPVNHKIALHPAPTGDMANEAPQRVAPHRAVKARVIAIESGGLVVRVLGVTGRNARGYVTSAGTGTPRGTELRKAFSVGQDVDAKVVEVDPRRGEVKLSIKALSEEQERSAYQQYRQQLKAEARFTLADQLTKKSR